MTDMEYEKRFDAFYAVYGFAEGTIPCINLLDERLIWNFIKAHIRPFLDTKAQLTNITVCLHRA